MPRLDRLSERHRLNDTAVVVGVHESWNDRENLSEERLSDRTVVSVDHDLAYLGPEALNEGRDRF